MRIAVIGAGYVGLVTGAALATLGHRVRIGEVDPEKVATLAEGTVPFFEADLDRLVSEGIADGLLTFHIDNDEAVDQAEVVIVAPSDSPGRRWIGGSSGFCRRGCRAPRQHRTCVQGPSGERPEAVAAGYLLGPIGAGLGADRVSCRRTAANHRLPARPTELAR